MSLAVVLGDRPWVVLEDPPFDVAVFVLLALGVDDKGYRKFSTSYLVSALMELAAEAERDGLRDWLLDQTCDIPDSTLAEVMIAIIQEICGRRWPIARTLIAMAFGDWHSWRGRLLLRGLRPDDLSLVDVVDVVYALLCEDAERRGVKPREVQERLDQMLTDQWVDRELWGNDVSAEAMMVPAPQLEERTTL